MAVLNKTYRAIICDSCLKQVTEFEESTAYDLRMKRSIAPYKQKDYCKACHPLNKKDQK